MTELPKLSLETVPEADKNNFLEALRMLAHRLSQPLTSLCGSLEVAQMGELDPSECRRVLEISLKESRRMAEILDTLRDVLDIEGADRRIQAVCWTRSVAKLLEDAASVDKDCCPQLASGMKKELWVKACPQHLDTATARLIGGAIRAARARREVRISLSARAGTACLSVCEEGAPDEVEAAANGFSASFAPEKPVLGGLEKWVVRRAIERQGGRLEVSQVSETCRCYQLHLPLASGEMAGKKRP